MSDDQSKILVNDLTRQFEGGLAELKYEYKKNLLGVDPLDRDALAKMHTLFEQQLVIFQHKFLEHLVQARGGVDDPHTQELEIKAPSLDRKPEIAAWIIGGTPAAPGIYGALRMSWKNQCKFISKHPAVIIGGLVIMVGAYLFIHMRKNNQRKSIRNQLIAEFNKEIAPSLRAWARDMIEAAQSKEEATPPFSVLAPEKKAE